MTAKPLPLATLARIRQVAKDNPEVSAEDLGKRFGVAGSTVIRALSTTVLQSEIDATKFPVGTHVKVVAPGYSTHARTGVVTEDTRPFPWRDYRGVEFDFVAGKVQFALLPVLELRTIRASDRPESARPREQVEMFGGAA